MSDLGIFIMGCVVSLFCMAAFVLLLVGAKQDGELDEHNHQSGEPSRFDSTMLKR